MYMEKLKDMLCAELEQFADKGELSAGSLDAIHKITDTIKNISKIEMLDEVSDYSEYAERKSYAGHRSYRDGSSYRQRRDSMGRYASDDGTSYRGRRYSRAEAKDRIMDQIQDLMDGANDHERTVLQKAMQSLENA